MPYFQEWYDAAKAKYGGNVSDVKTKEILDNVMSGTTLHGEGDRVFGFTRDQSNKNKNQVWMVLVHKNGNRILVNDATGGIVTATGRDAPVTLTNTSIDDKKVQWEAQYSSAGIGYRNMEYTDCWLNLAAGLTNNYTQVYAHRSGNFPGLQRNAVWKEKHLSPGEI